MKILTLLFIISTFAGGERIDIDLNKKGYDIVLVETSTNFLQYIIDKTTCACFARFPKSGSAEVSCEKLKKYKELVPHLSCVK